MVAIPLYRREPSRPGGEPRWGFTPGRASPGPFATILAPDGAEVVRMIDPGDLAFFPYPGAPGMSARCAYERAKEGRSGLRLLAGVN